jgi:hypothetical protein
MPNTNYLFSLFVVILYGGLFFLLNYYPICSSSCSSSINSPSCLNCLNQQNLITVFGIVAAITGWIFTSWVSMRNVKRQHTMNVLLQSRLSQAYQQHMKKVVEIYLGSSGFNPVQINDWDQTEKKEAIEGIKYLLNYFEFIAIGIKSGDLDEGTLRNSMSVILNTLVTMSDEYIKHSKSKSRKIYRFLIPLNKRWSKPTLKEKFLNLFSCKSN